MVSCASNLASSGRQSVSTKFDELAQRLARITGEDTATAIERAVEERLARVVRSTARPPCGNSSIGSRTCPSGIPGRSTRSSVTGPTACHLMIIDSSAIVAAISREADGPSFQEAMLRAPALAISALTVLETRIVLHARIGAEAVRRTARAFGHLGDSFRCSHGGCGVRRLSPVREGPRSSRAAEYRRLRRLRARQTSRRGVAVQGNGFRQDRYSIGALSRAALLSL
jgi:antitoxin VapB